MFLLKKKGKNREMGSLLSSLILAKEYYLDVVLEILCVYGISSKAIAEYIQCSGFSKNS